MKLQNREEFERNQKEKVLDMEEKKNQLKMNSNRKLKEFEENGKKKTQEQIHEDNNQYK